MIYYIYVYIFYINIRIFVMHMNVSKNFTCLLYVKATADTSKDKIFKILLYSDFYKYVNIFKNKYIRYIYKYWYIDI